jgi:DNA-binding transcriptional LysR family regulator
VAAGLGCTLLPALAVPTLTRDDAVVARPFRDPCPGRRIGLAWRRTYPDEPGIRTLAAFVRAQLGDARRTAGGLRIVPARLEDGARPAARSTRARRRPR